MSLVHVIFVRIDIKDEGVVYDVVSPDFSYDGLTDESLGKLSLDRMQKSFKYHPEERFKATFCHPELFEIYDGDIEKVRSYCEKNGLNSVFWSYPIYKKAKELLELDRFPQVTNQGLEPRQ